MESSPERTGVLILRVWVEGGSSNDGLRVRILRQVDGQQEPPTAVGEVDAALDVVRAWLEELLEPEG